MLLTLAFVVAIVAPLDVDPLVGRLLRSGALKPGATLADLSTSASGLSTWRRALAAGRVPDFEGVDASDCEWPPQPLLGTLCDAMFKLGLPRTTSRHPSLIPAALQAVLAATSKFGEEVDKASIVPNTASEGEGDWHDDDGWQYESVEDETDDATEPEADDDDEERLLEAATQIAEALASDWMAPLRGVRAVEALGGADSGDAGALTAAPGTAFSPVDGLWQHTGWTSMESVQRKLRELTELTVLINSLGQRACADGKPERGPAIRTDERAAPAATLSESAPRELGGLSRTGHLSRAAPSELALLASAPASDSSSGVGGGGGRRRLFLSRLAERQLMGYALEGWSDASGQPKRRRLARLPRSRGGALIVCLDTSHSMAGGRERLAKAVVLEVVRAAHSHGRPCLLFAFSGSSDLAQLRLTPPRRRRRRATKSARAGAGFTDRRSLTRLLDFLACSFGGGTDVAGPLRRALDVLEHPDEDDVMYAGADMLLISDGELPDPPLDAPTMERLRALQTRQGFEVHGLLVGAPRPTPLDAMCDQVHTCLSRFDPLAIMRDLTDSKQAAEQAAELTGVKTGVVTPTATSRTSATRTRASMPRMCAAAAEPAVAEDAPLAERAAARAASIIRELASSSASSADDPSVSSPLRAAASALEDGLVEREGEARLLLLALVGGEHLLLLGPPGTAKSALCRRLSGLADLTYFERTLTRFSTPEELFGPLSLAALENDEYRRAYRGYAPDAQLLFVDEIFKSNSAILNTLLTILNERLFDEGARRIDVPLLSAVAASNEGPESEELAALYDRFLLRKLVVPVSDDGILTLLGHADGGDATVGDADEAGTGTDGADGTTAGVGVDAAALRTTLDAVRAAAPAVTLPRWAALLLRDARAYVRDLGADGFGSGYVSDRRLRRTAELLKACAAAHGRGEVSVLDALAVLPHVLWEEPDEAGALAEWVEDHALPDGSAEQLVYLLASVRTRATAAAAAEEGGGDGVEDDRAAVAADASAVSRSALQAAAEMASHADALSAARTHLFLPPELAAGVRQRLLPLANSRATELGELAAAAVALEMAVAEGASEAALEELAGSEEEEEEGAAASAAEARSGASFTAEQLAWGKKEAKAKLGAEAFKAWKKAVKQAAKRSDPADR